MIYYFSFVFLLILIQKQSKNEKESYFKMEGLNLQEFVTSVLDNTFDTIDGDMAIALYCDSDPPFDENYVKVTLEVYETAHDGYCSDNDGTQQTRTRSVVKYITVPDKYLEEFRQAAKLESSLKLDIEGCYRECYCGGIYKECTVISVEFGRQ